ncbi:MAG: heavy metal translocating P-type ATPase [Tatlockia sp.]|jgi:heavy metal translocating P-type ATPase
MNAFKKHLLTSWQSYIALLSLVAIGMYFVLQGFKSEVADVALLLLIALGGLPLLLQIVFKLLRGNLGADSLAAIALVTAAILHQYLAASLIILMLASGQMLEHYALAKASSVLLALVSRMPQTAHRRTNNRMDDILLADIAIGDEMVIYPHEACPVDGLVIEGNSTMDESYLTGEPYHVAKSPGSFVLSGALNGESVLYIRATKLATDSRFSLIVKVLEDASQKKPSIRRLGDQIGAIFAPIALFSGVLAWYFSGDVVRFLAVLVIATPCPLLIAIPITLISAISKAAKQAIIIKDPTVLEQLPACTTAIFDKTGTLTYGKPVLTQLVVSGNYTKETLLQCVGSLERYSKHPLATAVITATKEQGIPLIESSQISEKPGQGLQGIINGRMVQITSRKKLLEKMPECQSLLPPLAVGLECVVLLDNHYAATLQFRDAPRAESKSFISHLMPAHRFKKIMLVSGDRESEVNYLADIVPFTEIYASQSPEQKLAIVRRERKKAPTVFMGDGINDAPALTAATVGIAFGQHSSVTAEAAGAVIMENSLNKVDELLHLSINTRNIVAQSAVGGMLLSLIGMGFAAAGYIPPVTGALLQEVIDVLAILNALRIAFGSKISIDIPES